MAHAKIILVTGASSGIGAAIAKRLADEGHHVFGASRRRPEVADPRIEYLELDVRSDESVDACVHEVLREEGRVDVLINNAGYLLGGACEEATIEEAKAQLDTNFFGVVRMTQAVLPAMRGQRAGHILTTSSLAGLVPVPFWGFYNASKFAVEGFMETLRHEVRPFGIKVALVEPGAIKTPFYAQPSAARTETYAPWRERLEKTMRQFEESAPGPEIVAERFAALVSHKNPPLRNLLTSEATRFSFLRLLLPARLFEIGTRAGFHLDKEGFERAEPSRRLSPAP
jgi:NAD(P)-dependent dehydrogenase (short-subunit alcohol dehydrogenase family)